MITRRSGVLTALALATTTAASARGDELAVAPTAELVGTDDVHHHHHHAVDGEAGPAAAHDHHADAYVAVLGGHHHGARSLSISLGAVAADYDMRLYSGHYEGLVAEVGGGVGRFGLAASLGVYQLERNGQRWTGVGDLMVHGHAALLARRGWTLGLGAMMTAPTGSARSGLGMGHPMAMADGRVRWRRDRVALSVAMGYGRSLGGAGAHAEHGGAWPLVGVMNAAELTESAVATVAVDPRLALAGGVEGALPIGAGARRLSGGVRALMRIGSTLATLDVERGLIGDPFGTRVMAGTTLALD